MKKIFAALPLCFCALNVNAQTDTTVQHTEIVVTGTRNSVDVRYLPLTVTQISNAELERNYNFSVLPAIMEQTPGLFATSRGIIGYGVSTNAAGGIKIRGVGSMAQLLVLIDGQPQFAGLMGHPIPDAYQSYYTEKVEIIRGPSCLLYGSNAMGGVINIVTKDAQKIDGAETDFQISGGSYGTFQASGSGKFRKGKFSTALGVSYQRTDGHRQNSDFEQLSDFIKVGYDISDHWIINADINLTDFKFSNPGPENAPLFDADADIYRGLTSLSVTNNYAKTSGSFRVFYDWGEHEINDGHLYNAPEKTYLYKHKDFIGGINAYQSVSFFNGNRTTFGFDYQNFGGKAWNDFFDGHSEDLVKDKNQNEIAGYVDFRQEITSWSSLDLGLRVDNHSQSGTFVVPQFGLSFYTQKDDNVKLLVSKGFRNPTIREMYMFPPQNDELKPEEMMNYEISYSKRINHLQFEVNTFYIKGENMILTVMRPEGKGKINKNVENFENSGFELSAKYFLNPAWNFALNYSFLNTNKDIEGAPKNKIFFSAAYSGEKFSSNLTVENISGLYIGENEEENYTLVNLNFGYQATKNIKLFVKGENLLAQKYQTYAGFYMPKATFMGGVKLSF
ncbi:MAG: TonB-dependent receptor [Bacteroidales bacterium]|nr:TonB-dependent receptor [Bacteroidales bacterium]